MAASDPAEPAPLEHIMNDWSDFVRREDLPQGSPRPPAEFVAQVASIDESYQRRCMKGWVLLNSSPGACPPVLVACARGDLFDAGLVAE
jgi:hypothetical protein